MPQSDFTRAAFAIVYREIPGRYDQLRQAIEQADPIVQEQFFRVLQHLEREIDHQKRRVRMPWMR